MPPQLPLMRQLALKSCPRGIAWSRVDDAIEADRALIKTQIVSGQESELSFVPEERTGKLVAACIAVRPENNCRQSEHQRQQSEQIDESSSHYHVFDDAEEF